MPVLYTRLNNFGYVKLLISGTTGASEFRQMFLKIVNMCDVH